MAQALGQHPTAAMLGRDLQAGITIDQLKPHYVSLPTDCIDRIINFSDAANVGTVRALSQCNRRLNRVVQQHFRKSYQEAHARTLDKAIANKTFPNH